MVVLVQKLITDFYCTNEEFQSRDYHVDRLWRQTLHLFKIKAFGLMFYYVRAQSAIPEGHFPTGWHAFGHTLPQSHVLHHNTFMEIMLRRDMTAQKMQSIGYNQMTIEEIEAFDQSSIDEYLRATFSPDEFVFAAGLVPIPIHF